MKKLVTFGSGVALSLVLTGAAVAADFQESMARCLERNANTRDAASVMLQCNAANGKVSGCTVLSDSAPGKGFDKAAVCVAEAMPIGAKTGEIKIPMKFPGA
jgi:hypothetical protein